MSSKYLMKLLKQDGWYLDRVKGSHYQFKHPTKKTSTSLKRFTTKDC